MNILSYIFTTNIYDDTYIMPKKNKFILSISSFWILNLLYHIYINQLYYLTFLLSSISIISPIFWYNYRVNSIYHKLDKSLVLSSYMYVISNNYYYNNIKYLILYSSLIFIFFIFSAKSCINNNYNLQLYSHQIFRFLYFNLIYNIIFDNNNYLYLILSEYILFSIYLNIKINNYYNNYKKYLFKIMILIIFNEYYYFNYIQ
jgi:hypothetical protein